MSSSKASLSYLLNSTPTPSSSTSSSSSSSSATSRSIPPHEGGVQRKSRSRRFPCTVCKFVFFTNSDLQKHVSSVHLQLRPYGCPQCERRFGEKSNANKHFRSVHVRDRPNQCTQCDAAFAFRDGLVRHVRLVHQGLRNFRCPVPDCPSAPFKQAAHLKKHIQSVHKHHTPSSSSRRL